MTSKNLEKSYNLNEIRNRLKEASKGLIFKPDTHQYFYGSKEFDCVSHVVENFCPKFDTKKQAEKYAKAHNKDVNEVLTMWTKTGIDACESGTNAHAYGEWNFYNTVGIEIPEGDAKDVDKKIFENSYIKTEKDLAVDDVWKWLKTTHKNFKLIPVAAENIMINKELRYAGTFDLLYLMEKEDGTFGFIIFDYKTNKDLYNIFKGRNGVEKMLFPFNNIMNCAVAHYMCQLNLYQLALENIFPDIPILGRVLLWISPEGVTYIDKNNADFYNKEKGSKWIWKSKSINEIETLKSQFHFRVYDKFAMINLPNVTGPIKKYLKIKNG